MSRPDRRGTARTGKSPDVVLATTDERGCAKSGSAAAEELTNLPAEQIVGQPGSPQGSSSRGEAAPTDERAAFVEAIIASAGGGIIVYDRELRILVWNPFMEELTGMAAGHVLGRPAPDVFPEVMATGVIDNLRLALAGGPATSREFEYRVPSTGRRGWVLGEYRPLRDHRGNVVGVVAWVLDISARRDAESALALSELQFRTIFDSIGDGVTVVEPGGNFLEVNAAACERLGYTREEMLGMSTRDINQPQTASRIRDRAAAIMSGQVAVFEATHTRKDGTTVPTEVTARRMMFAGRPAILSIVRDLSERRQAETALKEQARYLQQLVDAIPIPIIAKNPDGTIRIANSAFIDMAAHIPGDVVGKRTDEIGIAEADLHGSHDEAILRDGSVHTYEYSADDHGEVRRIVMTKAPLRTEDGGIDGIASAAVDITERYEAEQELRRSEARFRSLFEHAADPIYIADPNGTIIDVNRAAIDLTGYGRDELVGRNLAGIDAPGAAAQLPERLERLTSQGGLSFETAQVRKDGTVVPLEISATVIELGGHPAILGIGRDISERMRAEAERTALQEQLQQARKMEVIGQLAGGIAHDFNNLLTAIRGYSTLALTEVPPDSPAREDIIQIEQAADRAAALTRQLLAFARRTVFKLEVVDLAATVRKLEPMLQRLLGEDVELVVDADTARGRVMADASQIESVVLNLAVNARDAMPDGGVLTIRVAEVDLDEAFVRLHSAATIGRNVVLTVSDTGTGMSESTMAHLFEPFFTTKGPGKGTGLGLASVYGIVSQSLGFVAAETELGRGSSFSAYMPCVNVSADEEGQGSENPSGPAAIGRTGTILVVEDDSGVRGFASRVLELAGHTVVSVSTPALAIEHDPAAIDLLLTDVVMPTMNGREVANRLLQRRPDLRILFMSGHADETIVRHGILDASIRYLPKPFTAQSLLTAVDEALAGSPDPGSGERSPSR